MMIKCLLAQINTIVGDIDGNLDKAILAYESAKLQSCDLVIFPEQTLPGYPAKDLLTRPGFIDRNIAALESYAEKTKKGPASLIGFCQPHKGLGAGLYNAVAFCRMGRVEAIYQKQLLPTYDVFEEDRYFDEGQGPVIIEIGGVKFGITICEDIWNDELHHSNRLYEYDPLLDTVEAGAEVVINLSASPYTMDKRQARKKMLSSVAKRHRIPMLQVNLVGANDDLIFDGGSTLTDAKGKLVAQARVFQEDALVVELKKVDKKEFILSGELEPDLKELEEVRKALVLGIKDYLYKCGISKVLIGLSGGIDSALVAALAVEALGSENVHGVGMPSRYSSDHSKSDAKNLAESLGMPFDMIPIEGMFTQCLNDLEPHLTGRGGALAKENMQSRLRGMALMSLSNASGALVLATGNKSEMSVGYCTLYGDMNGGLAPIGDLPKLLVYSLARHINKTEGRDIIPKNTLTKAPSAELAPDQKDTDSLPPYEELDPIIRGFVEEALDEDALVKRGHDRATVQHVIMLIHRNEYKRRQAAPILKVTSRAFGYGWRMPIAKK